MISRTTSSPTIPSSVVSTVAGLGAFGYNGDDILATTAKLSGPRDVFLDGCGNLFIADSGNHRLKFLNADGTHDYDFKDKNL